MSHKPKDASHTARSPAQNATESSESAKGPTTPAILPRSAADTSDLWNQKNGERLVAELEEIRNNLKTIDQELLRFATRLETSKDVDQIHHLKAKSKVFEGQRRALVKQEQFILKKIESFERALDVQRQNEGRR